MAVPPFLLSGMNGRYIRPKAFCPDFDTFDGKPFFRRGRHGRVPLSFNTLDPRVEFDPGRGFFTQAGKRFAFVAWDEQQKEISHAYP